MFETSGYRDGRAPNRPGKASARLMSQPSFVVDVRPKPCLAEGYPPLLPELEQRVSSAMAVEVVRRWTDATTTASGEIELQDLARVIEHRVCRLDSRGRTETRGGWWFGGGHPLLAPRPVGRRSACSSRLADGETVRSPRPYEPHARATAVLPIASRRPELSAVRDDARHPSREQNARRCCCGQQASRFEHDAASEGRRTDAHSGLVEPREPRDRTDGEQRVDGLSATWRCETRR